MIRFCDIALTHSYFSGQDTEQSQRPPSQGSDEMIDVDTLELENDRPHSSEGQFLQKCLQIFGESNKEVLDGKDIWDNRNGNRQFIPNKKALQR
jgi:hypothetical protein